MYLGVTTDPDGVDWYVDMNAIPIQVMGSRQDAEIFGILEGFSILEGIFKESKVEV